MYVPMVAIPLLLSSAGAFTVNLYTTPQCTGAPSGYNTTVADGCRTEDAGAFLAMINAWQDEADNKLILATYSDKSCCHAHMLNTFDWMMECTVADAGTQSWRVLDPSDPDKGKDGDDYTCDPLTDEDAGSN